MTLAFSTYSAPCAHLTGWTATSIDTCGQPGTGVRVSGLPSGRRDHTESALCPAHGGEAQARTYAERNWSVVAPAVVGDDHDVLQAGADSLRSDDAMIVIREIEPHEQSACVSLGLTAEAHDHLVKTLGRRGAAAMGWRGRTRTVAVDRWRIELRRLAWWLGLADAPTTGQRAEWSEIAVLDDVLWFRREPAQTESGGWGAYLGIGSLCRQIGKYDTREEAVTAATAAWSQHLAASVERITAARGDTLSWGIAVVPASEPLIIDAQVNEGSWEAYGRMAPSPAC